MPADAELLSVLTLNLAHGRGVGRHQLLQSTEEITANLNRASELLKTAGPQVVGLQEVDRISAWNGRFDHFEHVAAAAGYPHRVHAENVSRPWLSYGAALLSKRELSDLQSLSFDSSPPLPPKGLVAASLNWQQRPLDVVSLHLDPTSRRRRAAQITDAIELLKTRQRPLIVMGDFNCDYATHEENAIRSLRKALNLQAWQPHASGMTTFKKLRMRFDWILVSQALEFVSYTTLQQPVSDHYPVQASLRWQAN